MSDEAFMKVDPFDGDGPEVFYDACNEIERLEQVVLELTAVIAQHNRATFEANKELGDVLRDLRAERDRYFDLAGDLWSDVVGYLQKTGEDDGSGLNALAHVNQYEQRAGIALTTWEQVPSLDEWRSRRTRVWSVFGSSSPTEGET